MTMLGSKSDNQSSSQPSDSPSKTPSHEVEEDGNNDLPF